MKNKLTDLIGFWEVVTKSGFLIREIAKIKSNYKLFNKTSLSIVN